jgi:hypothetical protein
MAKRASRTSAVNNRAPRIAANIAKLPGFVQRDR